MHNRRLQFLLLFVFAAVGLTACGDRHTAAVKQNLSDGEIFATIENGVRLTGMPGWGQGTAESAYGSRTLIHFIRHLAILTPKEVAEIKSRSIAARSEPAGPPAVVDYGEPRAREIQ